MTYPRCDTCDRPMRHSRHNVKDHPGTVVSRTPTTCSNCVERARRDAPPPPPLIRPCTACGTLTHPGKHVSDRPEGVARRISAALCASCYGAQRRNHARGVGNLEQSAYIKARRRRGIPAEGIKGRNVNNSDRRDSVGI